MVSPNIFRAGNISYMLKKLIVNADDFGLHVSINEAVEDAHQNGILTSASLAVNGESFEQAIAIAKRNKKLGVGIHLTLNGENPVASVSQIPSLIGTDGKLFENHITFCLNILRRKICLEHIKIEIEAQLDKFFQAGLIPTHVDSHRHIHLFPPVFRVVKEVLRKHNLTKIRFLNVPLFDYFHGSLSKMVLVQLLQMSKFLKNKDMKCPDYFLGAFNSGNIDSAYFKKTIIKLCPGITEINLHIGENNTFLKEKYGFWQKSYRWACDWEREYAILVDPNIKELLNMYNVQLLNYSNI